MIIIAGISTMVLVALNPPQSMWNSTINVKIPGGIVLDLVEDVITKAIGYPTHDKRKAREALATIPDLEMGNITLRKAPKDEQPSTWAASSISLGTSSKKPFIIHATKGVFSAL